MAVQAIEEILIEISDMEAEELTDKIQDLLKYVNGTNPDETSLFEQILKKDNQNPTFEISEQPPPSGHFSDNNKIKNKQNLGEFKIEVKLSTNETGVPHLLLFEIYKISEDINGNEKLELTEHLINGQYLTKIRMQEKPSGDYTAKLEKFHIVSVAPQKKLKAIESKLIELKKFETNKRNLDAESYANVKKKTFSFNSDGESQEEIELKLGCRVYKQDDDEKWKELTEIFSNPIKMRKVRKSLKNLQEKKKSN